MLRLLISLAERRTSSTERLVLFPLGHTARHHADVVRAPLARTTSVKSDGSMVSKVCW